MVQDTLTLPIGDYVRVARAIPPNWDAEISHESTPLNKEIVWVFLSVKANWEEYHNFLQRHKLTDKSFRYATRFARGLI